MNIFMGRQQPMQPQRQGGPVQPLMDAHAKRVNFWRWRASDDATIRRKMKGAVNAS
jgi:hypothetical protein